MAGLLEIRQGIAANLKTIADIQVSAYLLENPTGPALQVAGVDSVEYDTGGFSGRDDSWIVIVEGAAGKVSDIGAQKRFDRWLTKSGSESVKAAIETDKTLTSRLNDDGSVSTGQAAAAITLRVTDFRGYRRVQLANGVEVLLGDWAVQVETD